ncbi:hypothetical protein FACS189494_09380 [Spirochaetia bacterium]|nr:hypothetical protein FACS189494_09380 [Spirochaetia bacterium]
MALAGQLAETYGGTVLIDADPQGNTSGQLYPKLETELADILFDIAEGKDVNLQKSIYKTGFEGLSILPTAGLGGRLRLYAETLAAANPWAIDDLVKLLAGQGFKYCVIDTSPAFSPLEKSALLAADECLTPLMGDVYGQDGLSIFSENLQQLKKAQRADRPAYNKILFNAFDRRITTHERIFNNLKETAEGMELYCFPTDPIFRRAQDMNTVIQSLTGIKTETKSEITRLAKDVF